jgi:hypothetical protein
MICFLVSFAFNPFGIHLGFGVFLGEKIWVAEKAVVRNSCMFQAMKAYMECLKANKYESEKCRKFSKDYLECRMERYQSIILESFVSQWLCCCRHQFGSSQRAGVLLVMAGI